MRVCIYSTLNVHLYYCLLEDNLFVDRVLKSTYLSVTLECHLQEQYMFVYHALLEAYESGETAIPSRHLHQKFADLTRPQPDSGLCRLETEFNVCVWQLFASIF